MSGSVELTRVFLVHMGLANRFLNFMYHSLSNQLKQRNRFIIQKHGLKLLKSIFAFIISEQERLEDEDLLIEIEDLRQKELEEQERLKMEQALEEGGGALDFSDRGGAAKAKIMRSDKKGAGALDSDQDDAV